MAAAIAVALSVGARPEPVLVVGLITFGAVFAVNSAVHSYLILAYSNADEVALDVGFYYSANAAGRLLGTLLSGVVFLAGGLEAALFTATAFVALCWLLAMRLPAVSSVAPPLGPGGRRASAPTPP